jgi:anaphase-promoting complex subunit 6
MRAKCLEIFEKREQAAYWYKTTLMKDPSFIQAYDKLVDGFMTTEKEEEDLLKSIQFPECDQWLKSFYEVKLQKFEQKSQKQKEERINVLVTQYHLQDNADIMTQIATLHFNNREYEKVYQITKFVMEQDPYHLPLIPIHILTLLFLKKKTDLFYHAHKLAEDGSFGTRTAVLANFASACYYYACGRWDMARKYFAKSSSIDCKFLPALLGIGHSLSQANDPDLALASYRSTSRQFPNSPFPLLYMAMEHIKSNELHFAEPLIMSALEKRNCVEAWNEWGVILLKKGETEKSIGVLAQAISMCPTGEYENEIDPSFEYILYNLATAYRKARKFKIAYELYLRCMRLNGEETSIYTALGLTCHLTGELHEAIEWYHKGMARSKDGTGDNFVATMLAKCLNQISEQSFEYMFSQ